MTVFARGQCGKTLANGGKSFHSIDLWRDVFPVDLSLLRIELQVRLVISTTYEKTALGDPEGQVWQAACDVFVARTWGLWR